MSFKIRKFKMSFFVAAICAVVISCGKQGGQNDEAQKGKTTTSDIAAESAKAPSVAKSKPVHSTFENDCNSKRGVKTVKSEDGNETLLLHSFCIKNGAAIYDPNTQQIRFKGTADFEGFRNLHAYGFEVSGDVSRGRALLTSTPLSSVGSSSQEKKASKEPEFIAAAFCNQIILNDEAGAGDEGQISCDSYFIDLYVKVPGYDSELFDEQVEDCGPADHCLLTEPLIASSKLTPLQDQTKPPKEIQQDGGAKETSPRSPPRSLPVSTSVPAQESQATGSKASEKALAKGASDQTNQLEKKPVEEVTRPADLEMSTDEVEHEGEDLPETRASYVALNTVKNVKPLLQLFNTRLDIHSASAFFPADALEASQIKNFPPKVGDKPQADKTKPAADKKPLVKAKDPPKTPAPVVMTPKSAPEPVQPQTAAPIVENNTQVPMKPDPNIEMLEFPYNVKFPTKGYQQVFGGERKGKLLFATELVEPGPDKPATFFIDRTTKNLSNPVRRKSFGTFYVVEFLEKLSEFTYSILNRPIRINDISFKNGGYLDPHHWHQVGLDADVDYTVIPKDYAHDMTPEQKWMIFQRVGVSPLVNGIFIDIKDKRAACQIANVRGDLDPQSRLAMQKLKVEGGHQSHFHINFSCTFNRGCSQREWLLRAEYEKNEQECLSFKLPAPKSSAKK